MSKGLGKIERKILKAFEEGKEYIKIRGHGDNDSSSSSLSYYVEGLVENIHDDWPFDKRYSYSTYMKTYRAIKSLERKGYVETRVKHYGMFSWPYTKGLKVKYKR